MGLLQLGLLWWSYFEAYLDVEIIDQKSIYCAGNVTATQIYSCFSYLVNSSIVSQQKAY